MSELDRALDAALRDLVAGDGPPDLRRRVLARIQEPAPRPAVRWPVLAAAAAIVVAVASVALLRTAPHGERVTPSARLATPAPPVAPPPPAPAARVVARAEPAPSALTRVRPRAHPLEEGPLEEGPFDVEAGGNVESIELAPLEAVVPIGAERIAVNALTFERIEIEPLAEPQP